MKKNLLVALCLMINLSAGSVYACDLCAIYRSMEAKESKPGLNLGVYQQFTHFGTMQDNGKDVGNQSWNNTRSICNYGRHPQASK